MAEALLRKHVGGDYQVFSAGTRPAEAVHPLAFRVMEEIGESMEGQIPKNVSEYLGKRSFRFVFFVCADAEDSCPRVFPGNTTFVPMTVDDPARAAGTEEERLAVFRRVRDELDIRIREWASVQPATA